MKPAARQAVFLFPHKLSNHNYSGVGLLAGFVSEYPVQRSGLRYLPRRWQYHRSSCPLLHFPCRDQPRNLGTRIISRPMPSLFYKTSLRHRIIRENSGRWYGKIGADREKPAAETVSACSGEAASLYQQCLLPMQPGTCWGMFLSFSLLQVMNKVGN